MNTTVAARKLGLTDGRVRQLIKAGFLRAEKRGRGWDISPAEIDRQIDLRERGSIKVGRVSAIGDPNDETATFTLDEIGVESTELLDLLLVLHKLKWRYWADVIFYISAEKGIDIKTELRDFVRSARSNQDVKILEATLFSPLRPLSHSLPLIEKQSVRKAKAKNDHANQAPLFTEQEPWNIPQDK